MAATSILNLIAQATRLREGSAGVQALLRAVYRAGSLRLQDAAREARLPERIEARLLRCNPIETFDTALVRMEADLPDAPPVVLALAVSHATAALVDPERFWLLSYVPVFQGRDGLETLTPDLTRPMHVLRHSPSPG